MGEKELLSVEDWAEINRREWIDAGDEPAELSDGEWVCLTARCGAHDAAQSAADASHDDVGGRVGQAFLMMSLGDRGAGTIEGPKQIPDSARSAR